MPALIPFDVCVVRPLRAGALVLASVVFVAVPALANTTVEMAAHHSTSPMMRP